MDCKRRIEINLIKSKTKKEKEKTLKEYKEDAKKKFKEYTLYKERNIK